MKHKFKLLVGAALAGAFSLSAWAQSEDPVKFDPLIVTDKKIKVGVEKEFTPFIFVEVKNFQDESLGRIVDLGVDLINGRIVEVLVTTDSALGVDEKIVAVPPMALIPDSSNRVYRINASIEHFKSAAGIDVSKWTDAGRSDRVAAAYYLFGQEPYFLQEGETASKTDARPKVMLGYVERSSKLIDLPVGNLEGEKFGKVWSMTLNIPRAEILNVIMIAPGNFLTKTVIPATALSFNEKRDGLLLDSTKLEYSNEPRYIYTEATYGNEANGHEESYTGPHTTVALEQGRSYRDIDLTLLINHNINAAKINRRNVEIGTLNGRVTLRGWAYSEDDRRNMGAIAIAASRLEVVDNQITVGKPVSID